MEDGETKPAPCPFCGHLDTKLPRHLKRVHPDEPEVIQLKNLEKPDSTKKVKFCDLKEDEKAREVERKRKVQSIMQELRRRGLAKHNKTVYLEGEGALIPGKRAKKEDAGKKLYLACVQCFKLINAEGLANHVRRLCAKRGPYNPLR